MGFDLNYSNVQLVQSVGLFILCSYGCGEQATFHRMERRNDRHPLQRKRKGQRTDCGNCRLMTSLSVPGKVFVHVLLGLMQALFEKSTDDDNLDSLPVDLSLTIFLP